jgi:sugar phosphate isomerase/epimerase
MSTTRTGKFGIGFRRGGGWQGDLGALIDWARANDFACIDLGADVEAVQQVIAAGLGVGSVDLPDWQGMIAKDPAQRKEAVARNAQSIEACAAAGAKNFFVVMLPEDPSAKRNKNFEYMVDSYAALTPTFAKCKVKFGIEGWPGAGALCCSPETIRRFFDEIGSDAAGMNFDPSHLIRMGIDPLRFLREFADRVTHVHGKDTEVFDDRVYELGTEQPAAFTESFGFGSGFWRYVIPGHGPTRWGEVFKILEGVGYKGYVSIELEDENFNGTEEGEKNGFVFSRRFLESC